MDNANTAVRRLIRTVYDMGENDVRVADQTAPAGLQSVAYATVKIIDAGTVGAPAVTQEHETPGDKDTDLVESVDGLMRFVASVNFYGTTPRAAELRGAQVSADVDDYTGVTDGAFGIPIDGTTRQVTGLDFSAASSMDDVADVLETRLAAALTGTAATWTGKRFLVESPTTGPSSAVGPAVAPSGAGTNVSTLLGLTAAAGAVGAANKGQIAKPSQEAFDRARRLPLMLWTAGGKAYMRSVGLAFQSASQARDLSALQPGGAFEGRGQIDLTFLVVDRASLPVTPIESVPELGLLVQAPGGDITEIPITPITTEVSP